MRDANAGRSAAKAEAHETAVLSKNKMDRQRLLIIGRFGTDSKGSTNFGSREKNPPEPLSISRMNRKLDLVEYPVLQPGS